MDPSVLLLTCVAFFGGVLVVARVTAWISSIVLYLRPGEHADTRAAKTLAITALFLHSGPWLLAMAAVAVWYAAASPRVVYLWAVVSGLALAVGSIGIAIALPYWRQRQPSAQAGERRTKRTN